MPALGPDGVFVPRCEAPTSAKQPRICQKPTNPDYTHKGCALWLTASLLTKSESSRGFRRSIPFYTGRVGRYKPKRKRVPFWRDALERKFDILQICVRTIDNVVRPDFLKPDSYKWPRFNWPPIFPVQPIPAPSIPWRLPSWRWPETWPIRVPLFPIPIFIPPGLVPEDHFRPPYTLA